MDFPIKINAMRMGLSIKIFQGVAGKTIPNKFLRQSLNIVLIIANSADPEEMACKQCRS